MSTNVHEVFSGKAFKFCTLGVDGVEFVSRVKSTGVVGILALTATREIVLVEQFRIPVQKCVVELPAGLCGDQAHLTDESRLESAQRELLEETGFAGGHWTLLGEGPSHATFTDEITSLFLATNVQKAVTDQVYGVGRERITVHLVPYSEVSAFLQSCKNRGSAVDYKISAALFLNEIKDNLVV